MGQTLFCATKNSQPLNVRFMLFRWHIRQDSTPLPKELVMSFGATLLFPQIQRQNEKAVLKDWLKQGLIINKRRYILTYIRSICHLFLFHADSTQRPCSFPLLSYSSCFFPLSSSRQIFTSKRGCYSVTVSVMGGL